MAEKRLTICNTTPLINFAEIRRLDILDRLTGGIVIPPSVAAEATAKRELFPSAAEAVASKRFRIVEPSNALLVRSLSSTLHAGEAECIALGMENQGSLVLVDDLTARSVAARHGLLFTGTLGCLVEAKAKGIISEVRPLLDDLKTKARFWVSGPLAEHVLRTAGE